MRLRSLILGFVLACGHAPVAPEAPGGTLVVMVRNGPELVPFHPMVARIQRANAQIAELLGHSIRIELDGALLPQTHEGAEDAIARLVEHVAREIASLKEHRPASFHFAQRSFHRLVVRYAPMEASEREGGWRHRGTASFDVASKTVDVARGEEGLHTAWSVTQVIERAAEAAEKDRYATVLPDALPPSEWRDWFTFHAHRYSGDGVNRIRPLSVKGMLMLERLTQNDEAFARDVHAQLVKYVDEFAQIYLHERSALAALPADAPFRQAEAAYMPWLATGLRTVEERSVLARRLFDRMGRRPDGRPSFNDGAFPGVDRMAFALRACDEWMAAGRPTGHDLPPYFALVGPTRRTEESGAIRYDMARSDLPFYEWAILEPAREDALVRAVLERKDAPLATAFFSGVYLADGTGEAFVRVLRRFEGSPLWTAGGDLLANSSGTLGSLHRPLLEEARRLWREAPVARGHALLWWASHEQRNHDAGWPEFLQGHPADDTDLGRYLDLRMPAFERLPVAWPALARTPRRMAIILDHARALYASQVAANDLVPRDVTTTLIEVSRILCNEHRTTELAEMNRFARDELTRRPGSGFSDLVAESEPSCRNVKRFEPHSPSRKPEPRSSVLKRRIEE